MLDIFQLNITAKTSEYNNWEGGVDNPPFGCLSSGCSSDYGIVIRPDAGLQWNADERSSSLPYICLSKCRQTYIWHQGNIFRMKLNTSSNTFTDTLALN